MFCAQDCEAEHVEYNLFHCFLAETLNEIDLALHIFRYLWAAAGFKDTELGV